MKKKSLFRRKRKKLKQIIPQKEINPKIKPFFKKVVSYLKKLKKNQKEKINAIKKFFLIILGYGLIINYSIYFIFEIDFNLFTLFAWGIAYYFINDEFVEWFRRLIAKR